MASLTTRAHSVVILFWILAFMAIPIWIAHDHVGWDLAIYRNAIHSLHAGHDPYADAIAIQQTFHRDIALHPSATTPFSYVYSPITLPLLRLIGAFPTRLAETLYWLLYLLSALSLVWVGLLAAQPAERRYFLYIAPTALFFPGLLQQDTILSGNIAFILYALVLTAAVLGWRRAQWRWCYLAILLASCFKAPLLTLLAIPLFSGRRQWLPAGITAAAGIALFTIQPLLWPSLFHHFLQAVQLQFTYNRDFGSSPAGLFSDLLVSHGISYSPAATIFYLLYAIPLFALLVHLFRRYLTTQLTFQQWLPVLLIGVILLNPRIMHYDVALLTIPMALIAWRVLNRLTSWPQAILILCIVIATANIIAIQSPTLWNQFEGALLILTFAAGSWNLLNHPPYRTAAGQSAAKP